MEGALLVRRERGEALVHEGLVLRDGALEEPAAPFRQVEAVGAALRAALDHAPPLQPRHELRHVPLGHQQMVRQLLLRQPLRRPDLRQHVELRVAQPPAPQLQLELALDLLRDAQQPHISQHRRPAQAPPACTLQGHPASLALNFISLNLRP
nr:hypothetical protein [Rubrobacter marinus]